RTKRELDTALFLLGNETVSTEKPIVTNRVEPLNETLINLEINCTLNINNFNDTDDDVLDYDVDRNETLPTPEELKRNRFIQFDNGHQVGEAYDYDYTDYEDEPHSNSKYDYSYDDDYDPDYDSSELDYEYDAPIRAKPNRPNRKRRPNQNTELDGSFSNRYSRFKHPKYYDYHPQPSDDYGPPPQYGPPSAWPPLQSPPAHQFGPPSNSYGQPIQQYGPPVMVHPSPSTRYGPPQQIDLTHPASQVSSVIDSLEPVYVLTQSQIKNLVGQQKLNIEHLDVFQYSHEPKPSKKRPRRPRYPKKQNKRYRGRRPQKGRNKARKLRKLKKIIRF
ncbi:uncharacterized protein LOC142984055, partial [Anticarsia gemmatalis]|uniref:uncharacterized protein LOC142984055 n=1 Tax=Anticarsia gemmatalis TaxID=129554 RepID=UPI003F75BC5A